MPIILLGNKLDLEGKREVSLEEGIKLALDEKFKFKESSCLKNENVVDAFEALIELWNIEKKETCRDRSNSVPLQKNITKEKPTKCCS